MNRIEPRSGVAFELPRGAELTVCDPEGRQVSDLLAYNAQDVREVISNGRTFDYEETLRLGKGNRLWSNRSNPMLTIIEDTVKQHDFLLTPCSEDTFRHFYADKPVHRGCFGNLAEALKPFGIEPDADTAMHPLIDQAVSGAAIEGDRRFAATADPGNIGNPTDIEHTDRCFGLGAEGLMKQGRKWRPLAASGHIS